MSLLNTPAARRAAVAAASAVVRVSDQVPAGEVRDPAARHALDALAAHHSGPGRQELVDALTAKTGYHGVVLEPREADRVVTAIMGDPVPMRLVCSHCAKTMMSASERCSGSFVDTSHPLNVEPVEIPA